MIGEDGGGDRGSAAAVAPGQGPGPPGPVGAVHHRVGLLMHYPEVNGLGDVVIIPLQVIFDHITSLITSQFTFREIGHAAAVSDFSDSGMFNEETLGKEG